MIRGTTPIHTFVIPFDTEVLEKVLVVYAQNDEPILHKTASDCDIHGNEIKVKLSQEETLKFDCKKHVQIQLKALTAGGDSLVSDVKIVDVEKCLIDEVLV